MFYNRTTLHSILYLFTESRDRNEKGLPLPGFKSNRKCEIEWKKSARKYQTEKLQSWKRGQVWIRTV